MKNELPGKKYATEEIMNNMEVDPA